MILRTSVKSDPSDWSTPTFVLLETTKAQSLGRRCVFSSDATRPWMGSVFIEIDGKERELKHCGDGVYMLDDMVYWHTTTESPNTYDVWLGRLDLSNPPPTASLISPEAKQ